MGSFAVTVIFLASLSALGQSECPVVAQVELLYRCEVTLFSNGSLGAVYQVQEESHAGVPDWLQMASVPTGLVIYGTPRSEHVQGLLPLSVSGISSSYETESQTLRFSVDPLEGILYQAVEIFLIDQDLSTVLESTQFFLLQQALRAIYENPVILQVQESITAPPARTGVLLRVTPGVNVTAPPDMTTPDQVNLLQEGCTARSTLLAPPTNYSQLEQYGFVIDWCQYRLLNLTSDTPSNLETTAIEEQAPVVLLVGGSVLVLVVVAAIVAALMTLCCAITLCLCCSWRKHAITVSPSKQAKYDIFLEDAQQTTRNLGVAQVMLRHLPTELGHHVPEGPPPPTADEDFTSYQDFRINEWDHQEDPPLYQYRDDLLPEDSVALPEDSMA